MTKRLMRPFSFLMAVLIGWSSVVSPARAFAPVAVLAAPTIIGPSGMSYALGALAGLVGMVGLYLEISDQNGGSAARVQVAAPISAEPPAPSAASSVAATVVPVVGYYTYWLGPQTEGWCQQYGSAAGGTAGMDEACTLAGGTVRYTNGQCGNPSCSGTWNNGIPCGTSVLGGSCQDGGGFSCPSGYTLDGSTCNLINARAASPDQKSDVQMSGSGAGRQLALYPDDPDNPPLTWDGSGGVKPVLRGDGGSTKQAFVYGKDSSGRPTMVEVQVAADGTQTFIRQYTQVDTSSQSTVQIAQATLDTQTGIITSASVQTQVGTLSSPASSSIQTVTQTAPTAADSPTVQTDTGQQVQPKLEFPNDYAREPTVQQIRDALTSTNPDPADPEIPTSDQFDQAFFSGTFSNLLGWSMPGHSSQCPTSSFDFNGQTFTINGHCQMFQDHASTFAAVMTVVWMILALFIILGA